MAPPLKDRKFGTLAIIVLVGIIMGAYLDAVLLAVLPDGVVKTFFTSAIRFGVGDFEPGRPSPVIIDLHAVKFQFGFQFRFSLMSILGVFMSLYFFRWYK